MSKILCQLFLHLTFSACDDVSIVDPTATQPPPHINWHEVITKIEEHELEDLVFIVGNADGELFRYVKGDLTADETIEIGSATKWLSGATLLTLIEQGVLTLDDHPQQYLDGWTNEFQDELSHITVENLLSFTSGFHYYPAEPLCIGDESLTLQKCALEFHDAGIQAGPDSTYFYGSTHMQIAAAMAEIASGQSWSELFELTLADNLNLSDATGIVGQNPRVSGDATSSANDYSLFLKALLDGSFLASSIEDLSTPRTLDVEIIYKPTPPGPEVDWQYGLGVWRECDQPTWDTSCQNTQIISSPGVYGWYPWIDFDNGYYAVLALREHFSSVDPPHEKSIQLGHSLRPLIIERLPAD